jgi:hypothetical protein
MRHKAKSSDDLIEAAYPITHLMIATNVLATGTMRVFSS